MSRSSDLTIQNRSLSLYRLSDDIVQIDPADGKIVAFHDFSSLFPAQNRKNVDQVLNGIAYDGQEDVFYLTGKWWPKYYKIKINGLRR